MPAAIVRQLTDELVETGRLRVDLERELTDRLPPDRQFEATFYRDGDDLTQLVEVHSVATGELRATLTPRRDDFDRIESAVINVL